MSSSRVKGLTCFQYLGHPNRDLPSDIPNKILCALLVSFVRVTYPDNLLREITLKIYGEEQKCGTRLFLTSSGM
jgi:hypothetical protein